MEHEKIDGDNFRKLMEGTLVVDSTPVEIKEDKAEESETNE